MKTIEVSDLVYKRITAFRLLAQAEKNKGLNDSQAIDIAISETGWVGRYT